MIHTSASLGNSGYLSWFFAVLQYSSASQDQSEDIVLTSQINHVSSYVIMGYYLPFCCINAAIMIVIIDFERNDSGTSQSTSWFLLGSLSSLGSLAELQSKRLHCNCWSPKLLFADIGAVYRIFCRTQNFLPWPEPGWQKTNAFVRVQWKLIEISFEILRRLVSLSNFPRGSPIPHKSLAVF